MFRVMLRNLFARKFRLLASAFAIVLGVAFVAGSFILTDTLGKVFSQISEGTVSDVIVRVDSNSIQTQQTGSVEQQLISAELVEEIAAVNGVARADGSVEGFGLYLVDNDGKVIGGTGAPTLSFNYNGTPNMDGDPIVEINVGREPGPGEIVIDPATAVNNRLRVGQTVQMLVPSEDEPIRKAKLVGTAEFTGGGSLAGATLVFFDTETAQEIFLGGENVFNTVAVTGEENISNQQLANAVEEVIPDNLEAITGEESAEEVQEVIGIALGFVNTFLLIFAAISLVVGTFLIINTFAILVAQRSKELALLRALGASRKQITRSVLFEALAIGLVGSTLGVLAGVGLAFGIKVLLGQVGLDLSQTALALQSRTFLVSYAVGIVVTIVAAYLPARRAAKIPPIAAMRDDVALPESALRRRILIGATLTTAGSLFMFFGLRGTFDGLNGTYSVGGGILAVLIGVALLSPVLARPLLFAMGFLYRGIYKLVGQLATQNAARNPRRTAATASALMIGLALVSTMTVLGASVNSSIRSGVEEEFQMDLLVSNAIGQPFSTSIGDDIEELEGVGAIVRFQRLFATTDEDDFFQVSSTDFGEFQKIFEFDMIAGDFPEGTKEFAVGETYATDNGLSVGDKFEINLQGNDLELELSGIYPDSNILIQATVPFALLEELKIKRLDGSIAINAAEGTTAESLEDAVSFELENFPLVSVQNQSEFIDAQIDQVSQLLNLIYALLGLAIVIAILGIINTLALSVIERTREIGLLRAVGLSRGQLRRMIRLEAVAIAILGALFGVAMGVIFGVVLQKSLADDGINVLDIPLDQLGIFILVAGLVGILAAVLPARRAAKLNILNAISSE